MITELCSFKKERSTGLIKDLVLVHVMVPLMLGRN